MPKTRARRARTMLAAAVTALTLTSVAACGLHAGPPGTVIGKTSHYRPATKTQGYELTVRRDDSGTKSTFYVPRRDFDDCDQGSQYPECLNRKSNSPKKKAPSGKSSSRK